MSCDPSKVFARATSSMTAVSTAPPDTNGVDCEGLHLTNDLEEDIARFRSWDSLLMMIASLLKRTCPVHVITSRWTQQPACIKDRSGAGIDTVNELLCNINQASRNIPWRMTAQRQ